LPFPTKKKKKKKLFVSSGAVASPPSSFLRPSPPAPSRGLAATAAPVPRGSAGRQLMLRDRRRTHTPRRRPAAAPPPHLPLHARPREAPAVEPPEPVPSGSTSPLTQARDGGLLLMWQEADAGAGLLAAAHRPQRQELGPRLLQPLPTIQLILVYEVAHFKNFKVCMVNWIVYNASLRRCKAT
ncbi:unnamed protein product, partial [Urochloa humidicola]